MAQALFPRRMASVPDHDGEIHLMDVRGDHFKFMVQWLARYKHQYPDLLEALRQVGAVNMGRIFILANQSNQPWLKKAVLEVLKSIDNVNSILATFQVIYFAGTPVDRLREWFRDLLRKSMSATLTQGNAGVTYTPSARRTERSAMFANDVASAFAGHSNIDDVQPVPRSGEAIDRQRLENVYRSVHAWTTSVTDDDGEDDRCTGGLSCNHIHYDWEGNGYDCIGGMVIFGNRRPQDDTIAAGRRLHDAIQQAPQAVTVAVGQSDARTTTASNQVPGDWSSASAGLTAPAAPDTSFTAGPPRQLPFRAAPSPSMTTHHIRSMSTPANDAQVSPTRRRPAPAPLDLHPMAMPNYVRPVGYAQQVHVGNGLMHPTAPGPYGLAGRTMIATRDSDANCSLYFRAGDTITNVVSFISQTPIAILADPNPGCCFQHG
jgi:hypothetical protein